MGAEIRLCMKRLLAVVGVFGLWVCGGVFAQEAPPDQATGATSHSTVGPDRGADLRPVLDAMTAAVLAADQQKYLACVDLADAVFAQEQKNWAKDLERVKPEEFSIAVKDAVADGEGRINATLTYEWKIGGKQPFGRSLAFPAVFLKNGAGDWRYAGERWNEKKSEGVRVLYADGLEEIANRVAELLPEVRKHVHEGFGVVVAREQTVKLYNSMRLLQESIYLSYADPLSGWNEPGEAIKLLTGRRSGPGELKMLLAHEYGHVVTFEMGDKASGAPWWVLEGAAELAAEKYSGRGFERMVKRWAAQDRLVPWERMADFHNARDEDTVFVYNQGHHMLAYVSERFGRDGRNRWLVLMAKGASIDDATREALSLSFAELDQQWRRSLTGGAPAEQGAE